MKMLLLITFLIFQSGLSLANDNRGFIDIGFDPASYLSSAERATFAAAREKVQRVNQAMTNSLTQNAESLIAAEVANTAESIYVEAGIISVRELDAKAHALSKQMGISGGLARQVVLEKIGTSIDSGLGLDLD